MIRKFVITLLMAPIFLLGQAGLKNLKYPPLRSIEIPKIETATLPNGMQVMLLENHEPAAGAGEPRWYERATFSILLIKLGSPP